MTVATPVEDRVGFAPCEELSPRETQVLELIAAGKMNQDIANTLFLSINSVKTYIRSAYRKIGVTTRPQAVRYCFIQGLVNE